MLVVITDYQYDNIDAERRIIGEAGFELRDYQVKDAKELIPLVKDADAIITQYSDVSREVIGQLEHCKMIIKYGIGVNNIDTKAATEKGIYVCNVPDYGVEEVSDHAVTMMLALGKKMQILEKAFREGTGATPAPCPCIGCGTAPWDWLVSAGFPSWWQRKWPASGCGFSPMIHLWTRRRPEPWA